MKNLKHKKFLITALALVIILGVASYGVYHNQQVQSAADCTSVERYDPETKSCFFECETDEECDELARKVDDELNSYFESSKSKLSENHDEKPAPQEGERLYKNNGGTLDPTPSEDDLRAWELFGRISGDQVKQQVISGVTLYENDQDDSAA